MKHDVCCVWKFCLALRVVNLRTRAHYYNHVSELLLPDSCLRDNFTVLQAE